MGRRRRRRDAREGARITTAACEDLCRKCGRCCCAKVVIDDEIVYTPYSCKYLDPDSRLCTIYERRTEINPDCVTVEQGIALGVFPADCPYVQGIKGYRPPRETWTPEERAFFGHLVRRMANVNPDLADDEKPVEPAQAPSSRQGREACATTIGRSAKVAD